MKKLISLLLAGLLIFTVLPVSASEAELPEAGSAKHTMIDNAQAALTRAGISEDVRFSEDSIIVKLHVEEAAPTEFSIKSQQEAEDKQIDLFQSYGINVVESETLMTLDSETSDVQERSFFQSSSNEKDDLLLLTIANPGREAVLETIEKLEEIPEVEYAEPDYISKIDNIDKTPNDPSLSNAYGLQNISAPQAWDVTTGSPEVVVAIIDTGIDFNHPDLASNIWSNPSPGKGGYSNDVRGWNFVANNNNIMDDNGHGTHIAGVIGAIGNNDVGIAGVAWNVKLMGLKTHNAEGEGLDSALIKALQYADSHGAVLSNNSYGAYYTASKAHEDAIRNSKHLFVASAGNDGISIDKIAMHFPASYDCANIVSVASTDEDDTLSSFSNYGNVGVDIAAPGDLIYSTLPGNKYGYMSGTSMATPYVVGAAALMLSADSTLSAAQLKDRLLTNSDYIPELHNAVASSGRLNAYGALQAPYSVPATSVEITSSSTTLNRLTELELTAAVSPSNTTQRAIVWSSSDRKIATVNEDGVVAGITAGTVTITAKVKENASVSGDIQITVLEPTSVPEFSNGIGTPESPFEVSTPEELNSVRYYLSSYFKQTANIDMGPSTKSGGKFYNGGKGWEPIASYELNKEFTGVYDGNGYAIKNLYANGGGGKDSYVGLFGGQYQGTIQNVNMEGGIIKNAVFMGSLIAYNIGDIKNCTSSAYVLTDKADNGDIWMGGLIGASSVGNVENCHNYGKVEVVSTVSTNEYSTGYIVGGVVATTTSPLMTGCSNSGEIVVRANVNTKWNAQVAVGGVAGMSGNVQGAEALFEKSYNEGDVTVEIIGTPDASHFIGGVVGYAGRSSSSSEYNRNLEVGNFCYNTGKVTVKGSRTLAGGIIGAVDNSIIENCFNTGEIERLSGGSNQYSSLGGVVGAAYCTEIYKAYNTGKISGASAASGQLVGSLLQESPYTSEISSSYALSELNLRAVGQVDRSKVDVKMVTSDQMKQKSTFAGWDFTNVWDMNSTINSGYPYLRTFSTSTFDGVTFDYQGGIATEKNRRVGKNEAIGKLPITAKLGHTFGGWYTKAGGLGDKITETYIPPEGSIVLYAKWTLIDTTGASNHLKDVDRGKWYVKAVDFVVGNELFGGTKPTEFEPNKGMNRAMFVTVIGRMAEKLGEKTTGYSSSFTDVPKGSYYEKYVGWANAKEIIKGKSSTVFGSMENVSRQDMAVIFQRFANYMKIQLPTGTSKTFSDNSNIASYAKSAVNWASSAGVINGYTNGTFKPTGTSTRAEVAQVFVNFCGVK